MATERPPAVAGDRSTRVEDVSAPRSPPRPAGTGQPLGSLMAASSAPRQSPSDLHQRRHIQDAIAQWSSRETYVSSNRKEEKDKRKDKSVDSMIARRFSDEELATKSAEEKADLADKFYQETELRLKQAEKTMKQVGYCFWQDLQNVVLSKFGRFNNNFLSNIS